MSRSDSSIPHFLCIGAPKAGTAWLYRHLGHHPDIYLPPFKELHYFSHMEGNSHLKNIILRKGSYKLSLEKLGHIPINWSLISKDLIWYLKYFFGERNDNWYTSLFNHSSNKITGELTPAYARLPESEIQHVLKLNPDIKIIYVLRDPVARTLSQIRMQMTRRGLYDKYRNLDDAVRINKYIIDPIILRNSDYLSNIGHWKKYVPNHQMQIMFFDEMEQNPEAYLDKILSFLGLNPSLDFVKGKLGTKINGFEYDIPPKVIREVNHMMKDTVSALHQRFDNEYTQRWCELNKSRN